MSLGPDITERLNRARADLRMGVPIVLTSGGRMAIATAAEALDPGRFASLRILGAAELVITARRAETLKARIYDGDVARIVIPDDASPAWIAAVADPANDLRAPLNGPFASARDGDATLARAAVTLAKSARLLPSAVLVPIASSADPAQFEGLTVIDWDEAARAIDAAAQVHPVVSARVPLEVAEKGRLHVFRPDDGGEEHYAIEIGAPPRDRPVLARLHSACFTGDLLGSLKCDCGPQLHAALAQMGQEGAGILLYLNQEGRGIGLANKMRAYSLQDQGFDTVEANHRLGFEDDERDFRLGAALLRKLGFSSVRLMTNNPAKIRMMQVMGIDVTERVPLKVGLTSQNKDYLATKARKSGHLL